MAQLNDAQRGVLVLGRPFRPKLYLSEGNRCSNFWIWVRAFSGLGCVVLDRNATWQKGRDPWDITGGLRFCCYFYSLAFRVLAPQEHEVEELKKRVSNIEPEITSVGRASRVIRTASDEMEMCMKCYHQSWVHLLSPGGVPSLVNHRSCLRVQDSNKNFLVRHFECLL